MTHCVAPEQLLALPATPPSAQEENTVYVRSLSKHSPEHDDARFSVVASKESVGKVRGDPTATAHHGHHPRLSSAFNLLRSIPKPHFHHSSSS